MNVSRMSRRLSAAGVATALAAAGLIGAGSTAAQAATVTNTYTCSIPNVYSGDFLASVTSELPVAQYWAGAGVPAGLINVTVDATVPADAAGMLKTAGVTGARSDDFAFALGTASVTAPIKGDFTSDGTTTTWHATGANSAFMTPTPGHYDVALPGAFKITTMQGSTDSVTLDCVLKDAAPQTIGSIDLLKQSSTTTVTPTVIKVKKGKAAVVPVSVTNSMGAASGKVVAKEGSKKIGGSTLKSGAAKIKLDVLKVGKHTVTVSYPGNASISGSKDTVVIKVVR